MASQPNILEMQQHNRITREAVVGGSVKMSQPIYSGSINPTNQRTLSISQGQIRNVGLLLGFIIEIEGEVTNGATDEAALTDFGTSNILEQVQFDDLSNFTRIKTSGRHLSMLNSVRQGFGYGGAYSPNLPMALGPNNFDVFEGPATIAAEATAELRHVYYVPISYSENDLRGAIYMGTTAGVANLQLTLNDKPFTGTGNELGKVYSGNVNGGWTDNVSVTVTQVYLDQLPRLQDGNVLLPVLDLDTIYDVKETTFTGMSPSQDFPMAYSNFRAFLSTLLIYDNGGTFNSGSDINYFSLAAANMTNLFKKSPKLAALQARQILMGDLPPATYLFDSRDTPINTIQFGNMELNLNAITANSGARAIVGYESFGRIGQLKSAGSLAGG